MQQGSNSLPFEPTEYDGRLAKLQAKMDERGLDGVILSGPENQYYLTGYETTGFHSFPQNLIVTRHGGSLLVTRQLEVENATERAHDLPAVGYRDDEDPGAALGGPLREMGLADKTIGIEKKMPWLTVGVFESIAREAPEAKLVDISSMVELIRSVKSTAEVAYMRQAAHCVEAGMRAGIEEIREGVSEHDVAAAVFHARIKAGSHFVRNPSYIVAGERSALGHATWIGKTLEKGDVVFLELGGNVRHYDAGLIRSAVVGTPTDEMRRVADASRAALEVTIETFGPGIPAREVDRVCRAELEGRGFGDYYDHRTGYGIGIEFLTWIERGGVSLDQGSDVVLEPGMTCHVIPFFRMPNKYSIGFSETLLVTEDGREVLTNFERELFER